MGSREATIVAAARAVGFAAAGCATIEPIARRAELTAWLAEGRAGEMSYLTRRVETRLDPRQQFPWARSMIVVAEPYPPAPPPPGDWRETLRGRVAAYALGADYHDTMRARLDALAERLRVPFPDARFLSYVDTGAILEREWALRAGLGWIGKHTLLLGESAGSWMLLGELVSSLEVEAPARVADACGTCVRCIAACPTDALAGDHTIDPRRCLSYLTIEHRSAIPTALRPALGNWIFGCDLCQETCPWDAADAPPPTPDAVEQLHPRLPTLLALDDAGFAARFRGSAIRRTKRRGLLRNVAVALGNSANPDAVPALVAALGDPEPLVRGHAAWALGRLGGTAARRALDDARRAEPDMTVRTELAAALAAT